MNDGKRLFVFVALTGDEAIKAYTIAPQTGALNLSATSDSGGPTGALFLHPSGDIMLAAHVEATTLASYRVDLDSGALTRLSLVDTGIEIPALLITDRLGRFLLTAYYGGGGVTVHRLDSDGSIGDLVQRIDTGIMAHAVMTDASNRFVFVPHVCPTNRTNQFRFDAETGLLSPNDPPVLAPPDDETGPRHICFSRRGDIAYIVNEQGNTVTAHRFDSNRGTLEIFQHIPTLPTSYTEENYTAHVEVHPNGKWVYATNRGHDSIVGYNIGKDGSLRPFGHFSVPASPRSFNIEPGGRYCYCAGEAADRMVCYRIDAASGHLEPMEEYEVGHKPFWVTVEELG